MNSSAELMHCKSNRDFDVTERSIAEDQRQTALEYCSPIERSECDVQCIAICAHSVGQYSRHCSEGAPHLLILLGMTELNSPEEYILLCDQNQCITHVL